MAGKVKMKLSQRGFVQCRGNHCPQCGSDDISWGSIEINDGEATQDARCDNDKCGRRFIAVYKLKGYFIVDRIKP